MEKVHLIANGLIVLLGILLWVGNRNLQQRIAASSEYSYTDLLVRLKVILGVSEYDIFTLAASEKSHATYKVPEDFKRYLDSGAEWLPTYVTQFLEDGREQIIKTKLSRWSL
jgi:hypothetical protein